MKIKISEKVDFKPLTFFGIDSKPDGKNMKVYTKADFEKEKFEIEFNRSHFYTFYPVKKQMAVSFGENNRGRTGLPSVSDAPQLCMQTMDFTPTQVFATKNNTLLINAKGELYHTGERAGMNDCAEFQTFKLPSDKEGFKIKKIACGPRSRFVISEDNKIFCIGTSKMYSMPEDASISSWKEMKLSQDENLKDIVITDVAVGNCFQLFVTDNGKLWAMGNRLLKKLGLESEVPVQLPVPEDLFVTRCWASASHDMQLALIECRNKAGELRLYSAGKNDQGLLGQGQRLKEKKHFAPLDYDHKTVQFKQVSVFNDHAMAIDQNGDVWAWGSNLQYRCGFPQEINEGVYSPTKVTFFSEKNFKALKVSVGFDHSLVLVEDANKKQKLFSVGKEDTNFKHLGTTQQIAAESVAREIIYFSDFKIVDFAASHKFSTVVVGGDSSFEDSLYKHELPSGEKASGLVHFYKQGDKWTFLSESQYDAAVKSNSVPDVCFAIKTPITNWESALKALPDLSSLDVFGE